VLGTEDSAAYVQEAGGRVVPLTPDAAAEALVVCDERGFAFLESLDAALSFVVRRLDAGASVHLLLANPDLVYPAGDGRFGFTGGAIARPPRGGAPPPLRPGARPPFPGPGKAARPHVRGGGPPRRHAARGDGRGPARDGHPGAVRFGLDAVLCLSGVSRLDLETLEPSDRPTGVLDSLRLDPA